MMAEVVGILALDGLYVLGLRVTNLFDDLAEHRSIKASAGDLFNDGVVNARFDDPSWV